MYVGIVGRYYNNVCTMSNYCRYGPLVRSWCMRFEGKHNYFKDLAHRVKCFKNIPKSLASRHQRLVCYQFASNNVKETLFGPGMYTIFSATWNFYQAHVNLLLFP